MNAHTAKLNALIDDFVAGKSEFFSFWNDFMRVWNDEIPPDGLSAAERGLYEEAYELVYMGAPEPVAAADQTAGVIGAKVLRSRLQRFRGQVAARLPA